ncbi:hypothetical protein MAFF211491_21030 [Ralstonia solanacearum]|nr:hypothetical protein MAFF211491_21030 [Ralstonia solanacearum]BCM13093.1 hypothetical protein MAFF241648_22830 [Ralstonia solanacearum]
MTYEIVPGISVTEDDEGHVIAVHVSGLVGEPDIHRNTAIVERDGSH